MFQLLSINVGYYKKQKEMLVPFQALTASHTTHPLG